MGEKERSEAKSYLPKNAAEATWPEAFINPTAMAEKMKVVLNRLGVEI